MSAVGIGAMYVGEPGPSEHTYHTSSTYDTTTALNWNCTERNTQLRFTYSYYYYCSYIKIALCWFLQCSAGCTSSKTLHCAALQNTRPDRAQQWKDLIPGTSLPPDVGARSTGFNLHLGLLSSVSCFFCVPCHHPWALCHLGLSSFSVLCHSLLVFLK